MIPTQITTQDEFLAYFDSLASRNASLLMTKVYRGITLSKKIKTILVNQQRVVFQAFDRDICAALKGRVHLHSKHLLRPIKASVKDQSVRKGLFSLFNFSYINSEWKDRCHERVQPKDPTYITLNYHDQAIRASLVDISVNGMGVLVGNTDSLEVEFQPNTSVCSDFQTSPSFQWTKLGGAIHYQQKTSDSIVRLGIRLYPKAEQVHLLERYIDTRKAEILDELDQAYMSASVPAGVEYQYF